MSIESEDVVDPEDHRYRRGRRVVLSVAGLLGAGVLAFGVLAPPETCPEPTVASLDRSAGDAVQWFVRNQRSDGTWLYEYDTNDDTDMGGYNLVRHAGAHGAHLVRTPPDRERLSNLVLEPLALPGGRPPRA